MNFAIYPGSFNPFHLGHLAIAQFIYNSQLFDIDEIQLIISKNPPHKQDVNILPDDLRIQILKASIQDYEFLKVNLYEMNQEGISYTIQTIRYLFNIHKQRINYIMGADSFNSLINWHCHLELIGLCKFIVIDRDCNTCLNPEVLKHSQLQYEFIAIPLLNISSTNIRNKKLLDHDYQYLMHPHGAILYSSLEN